MSTDPIAPESANEPDALQQRGFVFAAVIDIANLVNKLLWEGTKDTARTKLYTKSLFVFDSGDMQQAYPLHQMLPAFEQTHNFLSGNSEQVKPLFPIVTQIMKLSAYLRRNRDLLAEIHGKIFELDQSLNARTRVQTNTILKISAIYADTLSNLPQRNRIKISGANKHINNPNVSSTARALLLAAIRAALAWHYHGGRNWHLLLARKQMLATNEALMAKTSSV